MRVLYTGAFRFPDGDAAALRVYSVAQLFKAVGYSVEFAGWEAPGQCGREYEYKGHRCYSLDEFPDRRGKGIRRLLGFLFRGFNTAIWLRRNPRFDAVVAYNPPALFSLYLLITCYWSGVRLILDSTEWYEGEHLPGGKFGLAALENWVRMQCIYPLFGNVICISGFLETHFRGRNVIKIPPLVGADLPEIDARNSVESGICFLYAGEAGKKDRLVTFVRTLPALRKLLQRDAVLLVAGMDWPSMKRILDEAAIDSSFYANFIRCYGRVSRDRVRELYRDSHFSVLFRENKRYALAGFPTKAVESWAHGCPIIGNRIGDFGALAAHMLDSVLVDEDQIEHQLPQMLLRIIEANSYHEMVRNCIIKARALFSLRAYESAFRIFASRLVYR